MLEKHNDSKVRICVDVNFDCESPSPSPPTAFLSPFSLMTVLTGGASTCVTCCGCDVGKLMELQRLLRPLPASQSASSVTWSVIEWVVGECEGNELLTCNQIRSIYTKYISICSTKVIKLMFWVKDLCPQTKVEKEVMIWS